MIPSIIKKQSSKLNRARKDNDVNTSLCDDDRKGNIGGVLQKCIACNKFCIEQFFQFSIDASAARHDSFCDAWLRAFLCYTIQLSIICNLNNVSLPGIISFES
jgi:hypothetical protein